MKLATLESADAAAVAEAVRRVVVDRGATVAEATRSHVTFQGLRPPRWGSYEMAGYVGTYQRAGEATVDLRYEVRARFPSRFFWWTVAAGLGILMLLFLANPGAGPWFPALAGITTVLALAAVVYLATWRTGRELEDDLLEATLDALRRDAADVGAPGANRAMDAWDKGLRADLAEARAARAGPAPAPEASAAAGDDEERLRERLRLLREQLEERRQGADDDEGSDEAKV